MERIMEAINLSPLNYAAISLLEALGNDEPTQQQIDLMELLIMFAPRLNTLDFQILETCLSNEKEKICF